MKISIEQYMKERLDHQINWYDGKSIGSQKTYKWFKRVVIVLAALIPLIAGLSTQFPISPLFVGLLGAAIAVIEGFLSIGKYHENWIDYRSICETLKHEKYMFLTSTGVYKVEESFDLLVERVESVISKENLNWASLNSPNIKEEK